MVSSPGPRDSLHVIGVDPGETIGVARVIRHRPTATHLGSGAQYWWDTRNPIELVTEIIAFQPDIIAVERYDSGGFVPQEGRYTIWVEGYIVLRLREAGLTVVQQTPQKRKQCLERAQEALPLHSDRHMADALAHALVRIKKEGWL
jgi:hypothetical protein